MTTPEHARATIETGSGRHRKSPEDTTIDGFVAASSENKAAIREAFARHGTPFAAFLLLPECDHNSPDLEETYLSIYNVLRDAIDEQIDALGWKGALEEMRREWGIDERDLVWNYPAVESHFREVFDVVEAFGRVHVFHR